MTTGRGAPVRILYDISARTLGGTEQFLARFLPALDRSRFTPLVISRLDGPPLQLVRARGIRTFVVPEYKSTRGIANVAALMREERVRLAQSNYYSSTLALAAGTARVPHVWRPGGHVDWGGGSSSAQDARLALQMMALISTAVICNSRFVARQFDRTVADRVKVIPNGVPLSARSPHAARGVRIGMVAHLTAQKRQEDFVAAALRVTARREAVSFAVVGRPCSDAASRTYAARIRHMARGLVDSGRLTFAEFAPERDDTPPALDVVVLPSIGESFSNALLEAMAAGIPVIAARSGGTPEIVEPGKTGLLVPPKNPPALAHAMLRLIDDAGTRRAMGRAARARIRRHFGVAACVARYEEVYRHVLADLTVTTRRSHPDRPFSR